MRRHTLVALGLAVSVSSSSLLLAGCEGDAPAPSPSVSPPSSSAVSPSESTSPSAKAETAEEFIRRWIEAQTAMQNSGDTSEFRSLSKGCEPCAGLAKQVDQIYADGGFVKTDGWTPTAFKRVAQKGNTMTLRVQIDNAVTTYAERSGGPTKTLRSGDGLIEFRLKGRAGAFRVVNLVEISTP